MTSTLSNGERLVAVNGVELCVETFGAPTHPAILFIDGAGASMLWWGTGLCERLAGQNRFVIRYDHRDTGRSASWPPGRPDYSFTDLTGDALGILDVLGIGRAHVVCRSWAGGIGLIAAVDHPERVASLTLVSTSTGEPGLPPPAPSLAAQTPASPDPSDRAAVEDYLVAIARVYAGGSPHFDETATRALVERDVARTRDLAASLTNHYAIDFDGPAGGGFANIDVPTLVVHGDRDPVFPLPHAEALRDTIRGAELLVLPDVGHELPRPVWDVFVAALIRHTEGPRS
jgi:pimeloyl-ACP methyl ester carboxylesterase